MANPGEFRRATAFMNNNNGTKPAISGRNAPLPNAEERHQDSAAVIVRLPSEMLEKIDAVVKARPVRVPRHTWILEAIHEKLTREGASLRRDRRAEDQQAASVSHNSSNIRE